MVWGRPSAAPAPLGHRRAALCARRDLQVAHLNNASETAAGRLHEWLLCRRPPSARPGPARRAASGPYQTLSYLSNFISDAHPWGARGVLGSTGLRTRCKVRRGQDDGLNRG